LQTPAWCRDGKSLLVIVNGKDGKSIVRMDVATGQNITVLPATYDDISYPADGGEHAFFTAYYNGITNIYAVEYRTGKVMQVTSSRFGAFDPQPNATGDKLAYSEYSVNGYNLVETNLDVAKWILVDQLTDYSLKLYETLARQEGFNMQDSVVPKTQYRVKPYRKVAHLLNVHSWAPLYYDIDVSDVTSTQLYPGVVLLSQDLLGNLTSSAGYSWRDYHAFHAGFTYKGLYPVFDFRIDNGGQTAVIGRPKDDTFTPQNRSTRMSLRSYIPFTFTRSRWVTGVIPQIRFSYKNNYFYSSATTDYQYGLWEMGYSLQAYRYLKMSIRDFAPRTGISVQGMFQHAPWNTDPSGYTYYQYIYYMYGRIYLPGIARHHSLQLSGAWQEQKSDRYIFGSTIRFPRGYFSGLTEKLTIGTIDYGFPLCYPDWKLSFLAYLKRIRTNLFFDMAQNQYRKNVDKKIMWHKENLRSVGIDLLADVHLLQINFPINVGIRTAYALENRKMRHELIFNVTFN